MGGWWRQAVSAQDGDLAGLLHFKSLDDFAIHYGPKWAYHLGPVLPLIMLPYCDDMKLAKMDGWNLKDEQGEPWPWPDLTPPAETVQKSHLQGFMLAKGIMLHRRRVRPDQDDKRRV